MTGTLPYQYGRQGVGQTTDRQGVGHTIEDDDSSTDRQGVGQNDIQVLDIQIDKVLDRQTYRQTRCWTD